MLSDAEAVAGFAMPVRASASDNKYYLRLLNADALAGIAKPARASASNSIDTLMNAEALAGFAPKGPEGLLEASS